MEISLLMLTRLVLAYSTNPKEFETYPKFTQKTKEIADKLDSG